MSPRSSGVERRSDAHSALRRRFDSGRGQTNGSAFRLGGNGAFESELNSNDPLSSRDVGRFSASRIDGGNPLDGAIGIWNAIWISILLWTWLGMELMGWV